jgi:hypothetical protein
VGRARSTRSQNVFGSNRGAITVEPPAASGETTLTMIPLTWNNGNTSRQRSAGVISNQSTIIAAVATRLAWSSITPFGRPVVPPV